jgi:type II secretory ATPase GspE/PulE/Tfp pilus assembly ATPase PilB-like protein
MKPAAPTTPPTTPPDSNSPVQAFSWPTPPYASYPATQPWDVAEPCEVEGPNGIKRICLLVAMNMVTRTALIQVPPARVTMPLQFEQFRSITLKSLLYPAELQMPGDFVEILGYRPALDYTMDLTSGDVARGLSIGRVETAGGVFLFPPADRQGAVRRVFMPKEAYKAIRFGRHIGQVLVEQKAVTQQEVDKVAQTQIDIRSRKLGDYLILYEIVSSAQLVQALDQQATMPMIKIGEALTALGLITTEQLSTALEKQQNERNVPLGELLVRAGAVTREDLHLALARKMGFPMVDVVNFPIELAALKKVPFPVAYRLNAIPLLQRGNTLVVGVDDPTNRPLVEELELTTFGKVVPVLAAPNAIAKHLAVAYKRQNLDINLPPGADRGLDAPMNFGQVSDLLQILEQNSERLKDQEADTPVEQSDNSLVLLINSMIIEAMTRRVSDIHIETHPGKRKIRIRFRQDGVLAPYMELPSNYRSALVARLKIMCDLDISERRKPQDGKIDFAKFSPQHKLELRVATIPTANGLEDVVMRLLASVKPIAMEQLGLRPSAFDDLRYAVSRPYGMVLCVGPTGSGKTTTLHSVLGYLNTPDKKIWTAEDPIEITQPDLRQIQINAKIDWTFAKALRSFLRADPDVIMVGEIRDHETAQIAIEASLTGHMVLSTLHTNSAPETIIRLLDMGMDPFNFADALLAVLAQRLVRKLCPTCRTEAPASPAQIAAMQEEYVQVFAPAIRPAPEIVLADWLARFGKNGSLQHFHSRGCLACQGSGLKGRIGVHELLKITPEVRRLIQTRARPEELQTQAMATGGMRTLRQDGIEKVLAGLTSMDEVRANCN